jgi:O-Antigen ligase
VIVATSRIGSPIALGMAAAVAAALALGTLTGLAPELAVAAIGALTVLVMAFVLPVTHLMLLLVLTAVVPYVVQNTYGLGGGAGSAGLLSSDLFLLTGLLRASLELIRRPPSSGEFLAAALMVAFLALATGQYVRGVLTGHEMSAAGAELRALVGFGALLIAMPMIADEQGRARLLRGLVLCGLALGLWGLAQWSLGMSFGEGTGDFGVREGVSLTSSGRGQLQGGLFAFPVAVVLAFAALLSGQVGRLSHRLVLVVVLLLNAFCLLVTYERTFWVVTVAACALVVMRANANQRARAILVAPVVLILSFVLLATLAPGTLTTTRERLLSIGQYGTDESVDYRVLESQYVSAQIIDRPLLGSGLGATVRWGRPLKQVPAKTYTYSHNGYLWIAWKLGIPAALLLFGGLAWAAVRRGRPRGSPLFVASATAAQAALFALLIANVTFPSVSSLSITATMGVLLAFCVLPRSRPRQRIGAMGGSAAGSRTS